MSTSGHGGDTVRQVPMMNMPRVQKSMAPEAQAAVQQTVDASMRVEWRALGKLGLGDANEAPTPGTLKCSFR